MSTINFVHTYEELFLPKPNPTTKCFINTFIISLQIAAQFSLKTRYFTIFLSFECTNMKKTRQKYNSDKPGKIYAANDII